MRSINLQMLDLLRVNQQKAEFVGTAYGSELNITDTFVLIELDVDSSRTFKDVAEILSLDKSTVSRSAASLAKRGYLQIKISKEDGRKHHVSFSEKGKKFLALHDLSNAKQLANWGKNVTLEELAELQTHLKKVADGIGASSAVLRAKESVLLIEMRRLTRVFGLLGPDFAGSKSSATVWQILSEIEYGNANRRAIELCKLFLMKPNTLSQNLSRLQKDRLIVRTQSLVDRRNFTLSLTPKGKGVLQHIEDCAAKLISRGFSAMSQEQIGRFLLLFGKYIGVTSPGSSILQSALIAQRLTTEEERQQARTFLVYHYVRSNRFTDIPETLAGGNGYVFALRSGEKLVAVCEMQKWEKHYTLANMGVSPEFENSNLVHTFLLQSQRTVLKEAGNKPILIPSSSEAIRFLGARIQPSRHPGYLEFLN